MRKVLIDSGINYVEVANEAAFYGPKIDAQVWSAIGREFTIATNRVDFAVPRRNSASLIAIAITPKRTPLYLHSSRAARRTHERFIGFLIEHYAGNFPLWLAPEQALRVMTLGEEEPLLNYAKAIAARNFAETLSVAKGRISAIIPSKPKSPKPKKPKSTRCWSSAAAIWTPAT